MGHIYAPVIGGAYGSHVCMYVYMVHLCTHLCLVVHVVHVCVFGASLHAFVFGGACMFIWCIYAHKCVWQCMYVYMVHINASVIGDACGAHAFQVIFTFQVLFM